LLQAALGIGGAIEFARFREFSLEQLPDLEVLWFALRLAKGHSWPFCSLAPPFMAGWRDQQMLNASPIHRASGLGFSPCLLADPMAEAAQR